MGLWSPEMQHASPYIVHLQYIEGHQMRGSLIRHLWNYPAVWFPQQSPSTAIQRTTHFLRVPKPSWPLGLSRKHTPGSRFSSIRIRSSLLLWTQTHATLAPAIVQFLPSALSYPSLMIWGSCILSRQ